MNDVNIKNLNFRDRFIVFLATGLGLGNIPFAPGSFGSLGGLLPCYFLSGKGMAFTILVFSFFVVFSVLVSHAAEKILMKKDPGRIVIDEIAGMIAAMAGLPFTFYTAIFGFIAFRFFDILKPWPISYADKKVPGGIGIVLDDIIAGIMANLVIRIMGIWI